MRLQAGHLVPCLLVAMLRMLGAQVPSDSTFPERARAAWTAAAGVAPDVRDATLPRHIAQLAGLNFQAKADRLTPDLDSALALSVMSGGRLRDSPWGWFALARQLQHSHGSCFPYAEMSPRQWFGYCRRVAGAYRQALKLDSLFLPVLMDLDDAIPWPALWLEPEPEVRLLHRALDQRDVPHEVRVRLERRRALGVLSLDSIASLDSALLAPFTSGEQLFLTARAEARRGDGRAALHTYKLAAAANGPGDHLEWIAEDLRLTGSAEETSEWAALAPPERGDWIGKFWSNRDIADGLSEGERMVLHARRWQKAFKDYRYYLEDLRLDGGGAFVAHDRGCPVENDLEDLAVLVLNCNFAEAEFRTRVFDDRGLTYLRHGPPQKEANYPGMEQFTKASWLYTYSDRLLVIHFDKGVSPVARNGMLSRAIPNGDWMTACQLAPSYCVLSARQSMGERIPPERIRTMRELGEEGRIRLLTTDGAPQRFRNAFKFNAGAYGLGSAPGRATLAIDVPLEALRKLVTTDSTHVALRWQVRIRSSDGMWPVSVDTVKSIVLPVRDRKGDDGRYLTFAEEFAMPPGTYDLRLVLSDSAGTTGAMYSRDGVPMISGTAPNLSDLVLMPDGGQGAARSIEGHVVRLSPTFTPGSARFVQVGYLLTGFADRDVRVTVEVREVKQDAEPRIAVTFTERPASDREFRTQRLGLDRLRSGAWDLSVSLTRPDGTTVTRTQRLVVSR